jgi:hypothetical protein
MIDTQLAAFLQEGIAIEMGTRNERFEPNGARVVAVAVEPDGKHLVAFLTAQSAAEVLPDLESNGHAALVCSRPPDERTCQVKGIFTGARDATLDERPFVHAQWNRWLDRLASIGYPRPVFEHWPVWPCVAIRIRAAALFNQTPGPGAGAPLAVKPFA